MHPYLNKNINVQIISFVIPLYMNNQKEIDGYNRNARADNWRTRLQFWTIRRKVIGSFK